MPARISRINPIICIIGIWSPPLHLAAFLSCFLMTSFTMLSITPLACNLASKLNNCHNSQKFVLLVIN